MEIVYAFVYSSCIHEEGPVTQSLHRSRKGAEMAMEFHKEEARKQWNDLNEWYKKDYNKDYPFKFGHMELWDIREIALQD